MPFPKGTVCHNGVAIDIRLSMPFPKGIVCHNGAAIAASAYMQASLRAGIWAHAARLCVANIARRGHHYETALSCPNIVQEAGLASTLCNPSAPSFLCR